MHILNIVQPSVKSRSRSDGLWQGAGCIMADVCIVIFGRGLHVREMALNAQSKHCSAKREMSVSSSQWQWAGCVMVDVCIKFD